MRAKPFVLTIAVGATVAQAQPSFRGLGLPEGYIDAVARGISADGQFVVGEAFNSAGAGYRAFRWSNGGFTWLGDLPGGDDDTYGQAVSAHGFHVVGGGSSANGTEGFRWWGGQMTGVGDLSGGSFYSGARCVSADGPFNSLASNLVAGDTNGVSDVFLRDLRKP